MSFASSVKDDLIRVEVNKDCCKLAEFAAFLRISGKIHISGHDGVSIGLTTEHPAVARHIFSLIKEIFALNTEIIVHRKNRLKKNQVFDINIPHQEGINRLLSILGLMTEDKIWDMAFPGKLSNDLLQQSCCQRAYLRGAFLAGGSINDPSGEYHLEIACNDPDQAELLKNIMASFEIFAGITKRKQMSVIYLKESEAIVDTLNIMGSHRSLLEFENTRIVKEMRNMVNRQT
ncbi:MAG: DNA-binding protein WhiA, partial [Clostridiales bacterium]